MKASILLVSFLFCLTFSRSEKVELEISWRINPSDNSYVNDQTGIAFLEHVAGFDRFRAEPTKPDGSASFAYKNAEGVVTVSLKHKLIAGFSGPNPVYATFFSTFQTGLDDIHGKAMGREEQKIVYRAGSNQHEGLMYSCSYLESKELKPGRFTSLAVVQIGDFLYVFRGTFLNKKGIDSFVSLLQNRNILVVEPDV